MTHSIVVADRDPSISELVVGELCADGYTAVAASAVGALALCLTNHRPDLVVLGDFDLGPGSHARLLRSLRAGEQPFSAADSAVAVVVLCGEGEPGQLSMLRCFTAGADDYLAKPAAYLELLARVRAVLARTAAPRRPPVVRIGALELDCATRRAAYGGRALELSKTEWRLLDRLASEPGRVHTKADLLRDVWGYDPDARTRVVDTYACRLRRKLADVGADAETIANHRGVGYALTAAEMPGDVT